MAAKAESNKTHKKTNLLDAALELFLDKGFASTTIDEIAKRASVAKGTFYLYFKDKYDIMSRLVLKVSSRVLEEAYPRMEGAQDLPSALIRVADYVLDYFAANTRMLKLVERNISWPLLRAQTDGEQDNIIKRIVDRCCQSEEMRGLSRLDVLKKLFFAIELCGSTAYAAILYRQPDSLDAMKPFLYDAIRRILKADNCPMEGA